MHVLWHYQIIVLQFGEFFFDRIPPTGNIFPNYPPPTTALTDYCPLLLVSPLSEMYDIIAVGATGYTGKFVAKHLAERQVLHARHVRLMPG